MTTLTAPITGLELVQREAFFVLFDALNVAIGEIEEVMQISDEDFAIRTGREYIPTTVERIAPEHFYEGHRPSLIKAPVDNYPNCAVWSVRATPTAESDSLDQLSSYRDLMYVEVMVKSIVSEEEVNRRILRTIESVNICIMRNPTLNGSVSGLITDPTLDVSDVFTRKERTGYGAEWFWQGARLEYAVRKEAVIPSSPGSVFRAAQTDYSRFIDQG